MSILKIARMGHPFLRALASPVEDPSSPDLQRLIDDMIETMEDAGGVGLAAPQIHQPLRLLVYKVPEARLSGLPADEARAVSALINPVIEFIGDHMTVGWEGCLSIPGLRGAVPRYTHIRYRGWDRHGNDVSGEAAGFHARVLQHEYDHLNGILYPERMDDLRLLTFIEEGARYPIDIAAYGTEPRQ